MSNRIKAIFLDDGGVLNDNSLRGPEWQRLVAEFFVPVLGGEAAAWSEANREKMGDLIEVIEAGPGEQGFDDWYDSYQLLWMRRMGLHSGVDVPEDDAECIDLAWRSSKYITHRVHAAYPGAREAVRTLHDTGYRLFTASNEHSRELKGYMTSMGVIDCFERLYGTDLVKTVKNSEEYYRRIFNDSGVAPYHALVLDDKPQCLALAEKAGAMTCLVDSSKSKNLYTGNRISLLADLPEFLETLV